jgi:hypothetical protein
MQLPSFLHIDAGNLITWAVVAIAWIASRSMDWNSTQDRIKWVEKWQQEHDAECKERAKVLYQMREATAKLALLIEFAERRIAAIELKER